MVRGSPCTWCTGPFLGVGTEVGLLSLLPPPPPPLLLLLPLPRRSSHMSTSPKVPLPPSHRYTYSPSLSPTRISMCPTLSSTPLSSEAGLGEA